MNGLSSTALQNTTSLAQPIELASAVSSAARLMMPPMAAIASMFRPARVEPTLTEAHTRLVVASACGMAAKRLASIPVMPFSTCAEKPPMKSTSTSCAARSSVSASRSKCSGRERPAISETGVTAMRLLMIGSPNSSEISALTRRRSRATRSILSYTLRHSVSAIVAHAVEQADADRDGADVELLGPHHGDGFEDLLAGEIEMSHGLFLCVAACCALLGRTDGRAPRRYTRCMALKISSR